MERTAAKGIRACLMSRRQRRTSRQALHRPATGHGASRWGSVNRWRIAQLTVCFLVGACGGILLRHATTVPGIAVQDSSRGNAPQRAADTTAVDRPVGPPGAVDPSTMDPAIVERFGQLFRRGYQNFQVERYAAAVDDFRQAVEAAPQLAEGHYYLARAYEKLFLNDQAEQEHRKALQLMPDFADAQKALAVLLYERGRYEEALRWVDSLRKRDPEDPFVLSEQANNYLALGRPNEAIPVLQRYNQRSGPQAWGYAHLGRAYELLGQVDRAESLYREAVEIDRHFALGHYWLGLLLARRGQSAEAQVCFDQYDQLRRLENAEHDLSMSLLRAPDELSTLVQLARTRYALGKYEAARTVLKRARQLAPADQELVALEQSLEREPHQATGSTQRRASQD